MTNFGLPEILIVTFIVILLFGSKKLPEFIKGLGEAVKEVKESIKEK